MMEPAIERTSKLLAVARQHGISVANCYVAYPVSQADRAQALHHTGPDGPRHLCFHPTLNVVYSSNEQGCGVTAYHFDPAGGTLRPFQTVSTLPSDFAGRNTCSQIRITPNGRFLYAPNRGHNSIAGFAIDAGTGQLTAIGHTPTEPVPRAFNLDPQGRFLFSSGLESGRLASYRIGAETGQLEPLEIYDIGQQPMWVLCVEL